MKVNKGELIEGVQNFNVVTSHETTESMTLEELNSKIASVTETLNNLNALKSDMEALA